MTRGRAAWSLAILDLVVFSVMVVLKPPLDGTDVLFVVLYLTGTMSFVVIGALLVSRAPANVIGPLFLAAGTLVVVSLILKVYAELGAARTPPLPWIAAAVVQRERPWRNGTPHMALFVTISGRASLCWGR